MTENQLPAAGLPPAAGSAARPAVTLGFAGFWIRVLAWLIDGIAIGVLSAALTPFVGTHTMVAFDGSRFQVDAGANAFGALIGLAYFVGLWTWRGQTIGMMPFGLFVARVADGERPDIVQAFLRYVGLIISFAALLLGVIWVAFDGRKQGWHDKLANTVVVRRR